jgi:hypothetical protein
VRQDPDDPWDAVRLAHELREFLSEHGELRYEPAAQRAHHTVLTQVAPRMFRVQQTLLDPAGDEHGYLEGEIDLTVGPEPEGPLVRVIAFRA